MWSGILLIITMKLVFVLLIIASKSGEKIFIATPAFIASELCVATEKRKKNKPRKPRNKVLCLLAVHLNKKALLFLPAAIHITKVPICDL